MVINFVVVVYDGLGVFIGTLLMIGLLRCVKELFLNFFLNFVFRFVFWFFLRVICNFLVFFCICILVFFFLRLKYR